MKRVFLITVRGKRNEWSFEFDGEKRHLQGWLDDGLDVSEVVNSIPEWAVDMGLTRIWFAIQTFFRGG